MRNIDLNKWGPATVLLVGIALLVIVGGILSVLLTSGDPNAYTYRAFLDDVKYFAIAVGGLAVGNGLLSIGKGVQQGNATSTPERSAARSESPPHGSV